MQVRVCEKCNEKVNGLGLKCPKCGSSKLKWTEVEFYACSDCRNRMDKESKYCNICGSDKIVKDAYIINKWDKYHLIVNLLCFIPMIVLFIYYLKIIIQYSSMIPAIFLVGGASAVFGPIGILVSLILLIVMLFISLFVACIYLYLLINVIKIISLKRSIYRDIFLVFLNIPLFYGLRYMLYTQEGGISAQVQAELNLLPFVFAYFLLITITSLVITIMEKNSYKKLQNKIGE